MILRKIKNIISNMSGRNGILDLIYTSIKYTVATVLGKICGFISA